MVEVRHHLGAAQGKGTFPVHWVALLVPQGMCLVLLQDTHQGLQGTCLVLRDMHLGRQDMRQGMHRVQGTH